MVRKGMKFVFRPVGCDLWDPKTKLLPGTPVRVCHPTGCPKPGTMGHCHIETMDGEFAGLVLVNSLEKVKKGGVHGQIQNG